MVGRRNRSFHPDQKPDGRRDTKNDVESGRGQNGNARPRPNLFSFKDAANTALDQDRREDLKNKLLNGLQEINVKDFRKSDEEVGSPALHTTTMDGHTTNAIRRFQLKEIKNKKVRHFYAEQNVRIDDWLEVDALVKALADDVLDSMNPDADNDGRREHTGGLQDFDGTIWEFLPGDVKEKRQAAEKKAKWAININVIANVILLVAKVCLLGNDSWKTRMLTQARSLQHSTRAPSHSSPLSSILASTSSAL